MSNALYYTSFPSAIGELLLVGNAKGLRWVRLVESDLDSELSVAFPGEELTRLDGFFDGAKAAINAYLEKGTALQLPYEFASGTHLQRAVWVALSKVPYGQTISYSQLAEKVGFPRAIRAVASACGANPLPLVIPCHRIVAKDGTLGGFSLGGLAVKEKLLDLEKGLRAYAA